MENKEEILKALQIIQNVCKENNNCDTCPFIKDGLCVVTNEDPVDWQIGEEVQVWRAFK